MKSNPHTIAESLILPACCEIANILFGENAKKKLLKIPLSNYTIQRRIINMALDVEGTLVKKLHHINFALHIDEFTDISGKAILLGCIRFVKENRIVKKFLCYQSKELSERTTG